MQRLDGADDRIEPGEETRRVPQLLHGIAPHSRNGFQNVPTHTVSGLDHRGKAVLGAHAPMPHLEISQDAVHVHEDEGHCYSSSPLTDTVASGSWPFSSKSASTYEMTARCDFSASA